MRELRSYQVAVTEVYRKVVTVRAVSAQDASRRAYDGYMNGELVLGDDNYEGVDFYVTGEGRESKNTHAGKYVIDGYDAKIGVEADGNQ